MASKDPLPEVEKAARSEGPPDLQKLWEQWDRVHQEEGPAQFPRGWNLVGLALLLGGSVFYAWGSAWAKGIVGPLLIASGATVIAVRKIQNLWRERCLRQ